MNHEYELPELGDMCLMGIDYGSKLAGTTVCATYVPDIGIVLYRSIKKKDADAFVGATVRELRPTCIGFDAPLSLPGVYRGLEGFDDYHYRVCDRQLKAMSPMFLGGLTARAMKLTAQLRDLGCQVVETYPARIADALSLRDHQYKSKERAAAEVVHFLPEIIRANLKTPVESWHDVDAILALIGCMRFAAGIHQKIGDCAEGSIII